MSTNIKLKRSSVAGKQPNTSILELGELAINTNDGKLFFKKDDGTESIVTLLEVTEDNLAIDSSNLINSSASVLSGVLDDLDAAITTAVAGGLTSVNSDDTLSGTGTSGSPMSVVDNGHDHYSNTILDFDSTVNTAIFDTVDKTFVDALNVDADTLDGANSTFYLDYTNFTNTPTLYTTADANTDIDNRVTKAFVENLGISYTSLSDVPDLSDPTISVALSGDVSGSGSATLTDLANGSISITTTVADDSHNHTVSTITDFTSNVNTAIDNRVTKAFVDALNVDADTLDGANGTFYLDYTNFTNTPTIGDGTITFSGDSVIVPSGSFDLNGTGNTEITLSVNTAAISITEAQISDFGTYLPTADFTSTANTWLATRSTTNLSEGTNLYYTTARANTDIDARVTQSFVNALNVTAAGVQANSVALGSDTTGDYVETISGGTGVTITGGTGESSTPSVAIGQDVSTTANVTFQDGTFTGDLQIDGDFTVSGNVVTINVQELSVEDNLIYLNANAATANPDLGWTGGYNDGTYAHAGMFRDASDGIFKAFEGYTPEPDESAFIDTTHASFALADIQANNFIGELQGNANTATALETARTIALSGDVTGSVSFDGTANVSITTTVADNSHNHTVSNITDFGTSVNTAIDNRVTKSFVDNLNIDADTLDGANSTFYLDFANFTNIPDPTVTVSLSGDVTGSASATLTNLANGNISITTVIQANSVALGTDTTGDYVESLTSGTGVSIINNSGEGSTPTISIGQDVSTTANVTFSNLVVDESITVSNGGITLTTTNKISGVATPTADTDAANKQYVDQAVQSGSGADPDGFFVSTYITTPGLSADYDLSYNTAQTEQETPFEQITQDAFNVNIGQAYDCMEPVGRYITLDYGADEAYVGA